MHTGYVKPRWSDCYISFTSFSHTSHYINTERNNHNFKSSEADRCKKLTISFNHSSVQFGGSMNREEEGILREAALPQNRRGKNCV
jgi:hypothetical protein